ncbi:chemotaxis phosphatase CheX [Leptospira inadai serovar Lyme str. 10]|uniref:Chemotaxis phosphatase CheX n=2 Tax=Leptospira inadai serovar Lyme TaxID=293084 RepID=V6HDP4_9LEPT|nr:chemotaxis protein CheX [Leptospira inadai]EQA38032.1 chemotaxis phosphatase CheX [Leptospira inadai serovar Lyme str. 10]PNV73044.1 chemotaxis protein CheX [Leptospira inadai serovar Lyme]
MSLNLDPLLDEKFILTISQIFPEFLDKNLGVHAAREAFGPSKNEGFCYENCTSVEFKGEAEGRLFLAMDGYTKLKLLPKIARSFHIDPTIRSHAASIMLEFANQICAELISEMKLGRFKIDILPPENLNHKLVPVDLEHYRQYILIYFLKDESAKQYLGRIYLILLMKKY